MPVSIARRLLPPNAIIGKTCNSVEHVKVAVEEGVDYVGLGPVWGTKTKDVTAPLTGPRGIGAMLDALEGSDVKSVAIGEFSMFLPYLLYFLFLIFFLSVLSFSVFCSAMSYLHLSLQSFHLPFRRPSA